jgi:hypothetical protein
MKYEYDDIKKYRLGDVQGADFFDEMLHRYTKRAVLKMIPYDFAYTVRLLQRCAETSYRDSLAYLLADNSVERAKAVFNGPSSDHTKNVLEIWLKYADQMSPVEKALLGWDKI